MLDIMYETADLYGGLGNTATNSICPSTARVLYWNFSTAFGIPGQRWLSQLE